jgi:L-fucose isomerase-like protein
MESLTRVGLVTFDFPPQYRRADVSGKPTGIGSALAATLVAAGLNVDAPVAELAKRDSGAASGIRNDEDLAFCADSLRLHRVQCLVVEVFHWARLSLVSRLVDELDLPVAVFAVTGGGWNGVPCATAICGGLREMPRTRNAALAEIFCGSQMEDLMRWINGVSALTRMRRSRIMLWGGGYGAEMPYSRSDPAAIESLFFGEVMTEQEETLTRQAAEIISHERARVDSFFAWLAAHGALVERDGRMVTDASLDFQAALYLAARDRLAALGKDSLSVPPSIVGASIKCHYEMSITCRGCTACFLPAFLPFGTDSEGPRDIVPLACEGDLNGVASLVILHQLNPEIPPLFGDLVAYRPDHVLMRNCGASSVYWAGLSGDPAVSLRRARLRPNIHGASGSSIQYETPACPEVTFARLFRQDGEFMMLLGEGSILGESADSRYDDPWPHTRLSLGVDSGNLFKAIPCNHGSLTSGKFGNDIEALCAHAGIRVFRCDSEDELKELMRSRGQFRHPR